MSRVEPDLTRWTVEELVGQVVMVGFPGRTVPAALEEALRAGRMGNVILFTRNIGTPQELAALNGALQGAALASPHRVPLLIAADQEGGSVTRLWHGATRFPGNMALGAAADPDLAYRVGRAMGRELAAVGITLDLAPVLDVNNNPANPVIGVRSFGEDPERVAELGAAWLRGLQSAGVAACAKHFPGHGDTAVDSHLALPVVPHDRVRLEAVELRPFRRAVEAGAFSVMTAHVHFPAVEPEPGRPATLSRRVLQGLLREDLGFQGVLITDCLEMKAIAGGVGTVEGAVQALDAGADLILVSHTWELQQAAVDALRTAVERGRIPRRRVEEAAGRVLALKERIGLLSGGAPVAERLEPHPERVGLAEARSVAEEAGRRAVTVVCGAEHLPLDPALAPRTLVVEVSDAPRGNAEDPVPARASLAEALARRLPGVEARRLAPAEVDGACPELTARAREAAQVVVAVRNAVRSEPQRRLVQELAGAAPNLVGVALLSPYDVPLFPQVKTWVATYSDQPASVEAAAQVLAGWLQATGRPPVRLTAV
ncbi:beta-N-acetylhexosaminidase [Limnochorda pilosa]|uniref:Beta-glucosidase n=1 Tax=Limnochorda pilosa TaxID=1555112 RepID=A0A0K2SN84_LIMPI|nr:beta-N-acetylhexosaminidase [Limnochorda pilosa]BAS28279.1 beta-glucosidase [Limnochorda pilosa]